MALGSWKRGKLARTDWVFWHLKMGDRKDSDGKGTYVNIQTNTDSIGNPDAMLEKLISNQNKSLDIIIVYKQNTHYT